MPIKKPKYKLTRAMVEAAPAEQGLYALWEDDEVIYLGRASANASIRDRLTEHLARRLCPCADRATHYSWELSLRPATREMELLEEFLAEFGRMPRCNEDAA
jgi:hypothetical protein